METIDIYTIKGAEYNPRKLSAEALVNLKGSITELGFILPIIINDDNKTIVAGHQRTRACKELGIREVPCYKIKGVSITDEIRFNQIHNGVEFEPKTFGYCNDTSSIGFVEKVPIHDFSVIENNAVIVAEMSRLIIKYGNVLCGICCRGRVIFGNNYITACRNIGYSPNIHYLNPDLLPRFHHYFKMQYGVFNYEAIERSDFVQGLAQPPRHKSIDWSVLYRTIVPQLRAEPKDVRILDFGCGKGEFIRRTRDQLGLKNSIGLEFFNHNRVGLSEQKGQLMIDAFKQFVERNGKFDYVICDAVINSVNTQEAQDSVIACLNLFCKDGGKIFFSGRKREDIENTVNLKVVGNVESNVKFMDENGLTAIMREGKWFFQKFLYHII
jgi:ParB family chromosome partitioning protein